MRRLARGGMGDVYVARGTDGSSVALKVVAAVSEDDIRRATREAALLARVHHPNVVPVVGAGTCDGFVFCAMAMLDGRSLEQVADAPLLPRRAAALARQLADALAAAHACGVVHRDVTPRNVIVVEDNEAERAILVDFGIARSDAATTMTRAGEALGTPEYMAPEQARGDSRDAEATTDVWGLGATLYRLVAGRTPFAGRSWNEIQRAILMVDPGRLRCPPALARIVACCLEKAPEHRYPSAAALRDDLDRFLAGHPVTAKPGRWRKLRRSLARRRAAVQGIAAVGVATLVSLGVAQWALQGDQRRRTEDAAREHVAAARRFAASGEVAQAWRELREVELRYRDTPALVDAYWAMVELVARDAGEDDVLGQEVWLARLAERPSESARAHAKLGRIYENAGFVADAARAYRTALDSGLAGADIAQARQGLAWVALLSQRARSAISGRILGVGDLDGDRRPELLVLTDDAILALGWAGGHWAEGARYRVAPDDRAKLWQDADPSGPDRWIGQLAALGGIPGPQLVLRSHVWGFEGGRVHLIAELPYGAHAIGDLDGDGRDDLVVAIAPGAGQRQLLMCRLAGDGALACHELASVARNESSIPALAVVDLDGDGRNELVMSEAEWTRYAVTIGQLSPAGFSIVAQRQLGSIRGLAAIDLDGDHRREIIALKSHIYPSPRLFDIDPYLGPSGPMILSWDGQASLDRTWLDPVVPADSSDRHLRLEVVARTRLGPTWFVREIDDDRLDIYVRAEDGAIARHRVGRMTELDSAAAHIVALDLDGDGRDELVTDAGTITAFGIGEAVNPQLASPASSDRLVLARQLREAGHGRLALQACRSALEAGADPGRVAFEQGLAHRTLGHPGDALADYQRARAAGFANRELWRAMVDAAEAAGDWAAAHEAALSDGDRAAAAGAAAILDLAPRLTQAFAAPLSPSIEVRDGLPCRGRGDRGGMRIALFPDQRVFSVPFAWDGSTAEFRLTFAPIDLEYTEGLPITIASDTDVEIGAGLWGHGGGGVLWLEISLGTSRQWSQRDLGYFFQPGETIRLDWRSLPSELELRLSWVAHRRRWDVALYGAGKRIAAATVPGSAISPGHHHFVIGPRPGTFGPYWTASEVELLQLELRGGSGLAIAPRAADDPDRALCTGGASTAHTSSRGSDPRAMLARAVSLGVAGDLTAARRELAAYRSAVSQTPPTIMFEYDEWRGGAWERAAVEIMHRDRALARTLLVDSGLMSHARYAELLRRAIYQQYVDSGQTAWRRAIPGLEEVIALVPGDAEAWYYLGYCHYRLGSDLEARRAFERALDLDPALEARYPKQGGPAMLLAKLAGRGGDRNAARRWLARAVELHGNLDIAAHDPRLAALVPEAGTPLR